MTPPINPKNHSSKTILDKTIKFRLSKDELEELKLRAKNAMMPVSEYIRTSALHNSVIKTIPKAASPNLNPASFELRKIGAMMKSLYPKESNWTNEEKRKYWASMKELLSLARKIEGEVDAG